MEKSQQLSAAQCILLTVHLAAEANITALHSFTPTRLDALDPELVLRILLTYLPEALDPGEYASYVGEVASRLYLDFRRQDSDVDLSAVEGLSDEQAQRQVKKLRLASISPPDFPAHAPDDLLTSFLCHRAARIDEETGLLHLIPKLIEPHLDRNDYLRTWYISAVLPLLRLELDYYPDDAPQTRSIAEFTTLDGPSGIEFLLRKAAGAKPASSTGDAAKTSNIGRDIKGLVGPWMYGHTERKRRKLGHEAVPDETQRKGDETDLSLGIRKISLSGVSEQDKTGHDWEYMYRWMVEHSIKNFELVSQAIEDWDGPRDVDLGGFDEGGIQYLDDDVQSKLELQYAQAAFASCYAVKANTQETVREAHGVLARLAELLDFIPPPDLATSVDSLPRMERQAVKMSDPQTDLSADALLRPEHPLTTPRMETYMLLQMMVYSAYQFAGVGHALSLTNVAKLHFISTAEEQLDLFRKILRGLVKSGARKDDTQWLADRARLLWLWNWGIDPDPSDPDHGAGTLGKIGREDFEEEMLKVFTETSCYQLATQTYITNKRLIPASRVEEIVLRVAMEAYDGASNGNRTRGGVKKANDIIHAFQPCFPDSARFREATALTAATHALSFYSLTLQHGVPFQPVSIRVSQDPISLISKALEQNPRSYTKLDDLVFIAQNLVSAGLSQSDESPETKRRPSVPSPDELVKRKQDAERRVTLMAIEASLREDDFETTYSYIVNRLTPTGADIKAPDQRSTSSAKRQSQGHGKRSSQARNDHEDDVSWRAAFLAGRYRPSTASPPTIRRLEQRTELLSLALLLAPTSALTDILAAWRRCEEEMTALQLSQQQAEDEFDDRADKRLSSTLPGNFTVHGEQPELVLNQKRREVGRLGAVSADTPLSMFDLTRNAARIFSSNAFPLRQAAATSGAGEREDDDDDETTGGGRRMRESISSIGSFGSDSESAARVRKRDMVANAVSGGLASGLGWVLGATPAGQQE